MFVHVLVVAVLFSFFDSDLPPVQQKGLATGYAAWKKEWMNIRGRRVRVSTGKPYCWYYRKVKRGDPIVAHRTLPCGTKVYVTNLANGRGAWMPVGDRGPYGACGPKRKVLRLIKRLSPPLRKKVVWKPSKWCRKKYGKRSVWYVKLRASWPGEWRGVMDISHTARRLIGHDGWENVTLRYWPKRLAMLAGAF
jgi:hypothetical protein